ncbi:DUF6538 domain-containing protein [Yoonia sp. MH D7]
MRNPTYLVLSRHGVFYFRWPLPASRHPENRRSEVRLSLRTRRPSVALMLARAMAVGGLLHLDIQVGHRPCAMANASTRP